MTVWSLTPLFNELDVLEIRLAELDDVVDVHVIAESTLTYSGDEKPLYFAENKERFEPWLHKIRHVVVDDSPNGAKTANPPNLLHPCDSDRWARENHQRDALSRGIDGMKDDDLVLLSDLDEIPFAPTVSHFTDFARLQGTAILRPKLPVHVMYLDWRWAAPPIPVVCRFMRGETLKNLGPQAARLQVGAVYGTNEVGGLGWHFAYLGGVQAIKHKISSAAHHEVDRPPFNTDDWIEQCLVSGHDLFGRPDKVCERAPKESLPAHVQERWQDYEERGLLAPDDGGAR